MVDNHVLPVVYLMGPTASGKTALAMQVFSRLPVEIISVDSALVYRGLDIGTAKPSAAELAKVPHQLIDICELSENYSAGRFCHDAEQAIKAIKAKGKIPLLVGGTGLYFRSLEQGFSQLPRSDADTREYWSACLRQWGSAKAHEKLAKIDPQSAQRIHPNDRQRIQRALEVYAMQGKTLSALLAEGRQAGLEQAVIKFVLAPDERAVLHANIEKRFDKMLSQGLLDEVQGFYQRQDIHENLSAMRLVGYRQVWRYLAGETPFEEMRERAIVATRQLAKRQLTWFRAEADTLWLEPRNPQVVDDILQKIDKYADF